MKCPAYRTWKQIGEHMKLLVRHCMTATVTGKQQSSGKGYQRKPVGRYSSHANKRAEGIRQLLKQKKDAALPLGGTLQEQKDRLRDGGVVTVQYPWMQQSHLTRSQEVVNLVNDELRENEEPTACYLGLSTLTSRDDMLEMHAARPIQKGECILIDRTTTGICSNVGNECCDNCYGHVTSSPTRATCCSAVYCSAACHDLALNTYHKALCGQDFRWLSAPAKGLTHNASPLRPLLTLRFLASCVQTSVETSPLDHPLIARLQPLANCSHLDVFTFAESITTPIRMLQQLNVDIFANRNFYTMVLHTIWTRIANNKAGAADRESGFVHAITPSLSLFNHSCEPNVEWEWEGGSAKIRFLAKRGIAKDEELFSSYLDVDNVALEQRTERLWPWFEGPCLCAKCKRESAQSR